MGSGTWRAITSNDDTPILDKHLTLKCPHCGAKSGFTAVSVPRFPQLARYVPDKVIVGYRCDACNAAVALRFMVFGAYNNFFADLSESYEELERPMETFDYQHLPIAVADDFREALTCYSHSCYNATAAMCRRTIQSVSTDLGASGTDRVQKQLVEAKDIAGMDDTTFLALKQAMLDGHDGAHPHLPEISPERAAVLVELMKDVLTQLYARKARIQAAMQLRQEAIEVKKSR